MKKTWIYLLAIAFALSFGCCPNKDKNCPCKESSSLEKSSGSIIGDTTDGPAQDEPSNDQDDENEMASLTDEDESNEPTIEEDSAIVQDDTEPADEVESEEKEIAQADTQDIETIAEPETNTEPENTEE